MARVLRQRIECYLFIYKIAEGEHIEMGGVIDPDRGAIVYKKTTKVETVDKQEGSEFARKKIKKVTSETSWLGKPATEDQAVLMEEQEEKWHDEQVEQNPLYSTKDYVTNFSNPLYNRRMSGIEGGGDDVEDHSRSSRASGTSSGKDGRAARGRPTSQDTGGKEYVDYLSEQPDLGKADTLF